MNASAQAKKLYHLAIKPCSRARLARVNEQQPAELYEVVFQKLLQQTRQFAPKHRFKFSGKIYLLDATVVDLCLSVFPWAKFRKAKGAIKIHMGWCNGRLPSSPLPVMSRRHFLNHPLSPCSRWPGQQK